MIEVVEVGATKLDKKNNSLTIQCKRLAGEDEQDAQDLGYVPVWYTPGFAAAPPTGTQGFYDSDLKAVFAFRHNATGEMFGKLATGESLMYGPSYNFVRCKADGSVAMFTTDNGKSDGQSVYAQVAKDKFVRYAPWGVERFEQGGYTLVHSSGAMFMMGGIGGLPSPLDSFGNYATISAAMIKLQGATIMLGSELGAAEPPAKALALQTCLVLIGTALTDIGAALTALGNGSAAASVTAALAGIASAAETVPANSVTVT